MAGKPKNELRSDVNSRTPGDTAEKHILLRRMPPAEAAKKVYQLEGIFLDELLTFVRDGFKGGDSVVVIASSHHLAVLDRRLRAESFDVFYLTLRDHYIPLNAEALMDKFLVQGHPDEVLFQHLVMTLGTRVLKSEKNIRVFSEMAALLWLKGERDAAKQIETHWGRLIKTTKDYPQVKLKTETIAYSANGGIFYESDDC